MAQEKLNQLTGVKVISITGIVPKKIIVINDVHIIDFKPSITSTKTKEI